MNSVTETEQESTDDPPITQEAQAVQYVPLSTLVLEHTFWANPRTILDDDKLAELQLSIKERGILVALHIARLQVNGKIVHLVLDGQRRVMAGNRVLPKDYPVPVRDVWPEVIENFNWEISDKLLDIALDIGNRREALSSYELVETGERLKGRGKTNQEIARALNRSETWVSRMLKARLNATPVLLNKWKNGALTDEQFKGVASERNPERQVEAVQAVAEAKKADRGEARLKSKEIEAAAKAKEEKTRAKPAKGSNGVKAGIKPVVRGPQADLPIPPVKRTMVSRVVLEDMLGLASRHPPVHDYVRGVFDAVAYVLGEMSLEAFSKPWHHYLSRMLNGTPSDVVEDSKDAKPPKERKKKARGKAKRRGKAK